MYFRVKRTGAYAYLQIVESFREQGQVHQRVLTPLSLLATDFAFFREGTLWIS